MLVTHDEKLYMETMEAEAEQAAAAVICGRRHISIRRIGQLQEKRSVCASTVINENFITIKTSG
jgi:hypothetical protein